MFLNRHFQGMLQILIYRGVIAAPNRLFRPPFQRWFSTSSGAVQGRVALGSALSFVSFSLGLFLQRKAAKPFWYQDLLDAFSFATRGTNLSCLTYVSHLLTQNRKRKSFAKRKCRFCANASRAVAFEKATQNNRVKQALTHR